MAYPANKLNDPNAIAIMFDKKDLNGLVELFPTEEQDMERLRLHYVTVEEEP